MKANLFWLNDEQWAKIGPLIPMNRPGQKPRNNRRILSGIIHVLKTGYRWKDCPPKYGPYTMAYNRFNRWSGRGTWQEIFATVAGSPLAARTGALDSTHVKAHRCAGGGKGGPRSRRSASPKVAKQQDSWACRQGVPLVGLNPHPGNAADCAVRASMRQFGLTASRNCSATACDSNWFRKSLRKEGIRHVIPGRSNRKKRIRHDKQVYKARNVIERFCCRLKDFKRVATPR
jgi:transposase